MKCRCQTIEPNELGRHGGAYLAEGIEYVVEIYQNLPFCYLCNVVHGLACVITNPCVLVSEAGQDWRNDLLQVSREFLQRVSHSVCEKLKCFATSAMRYVAQCWRRQKAGRSR
jgi:hypothetical protein